MPNETHDPARRSWVSSANRADTDFPIQNLPFGCFRRLGEAPRSGVAIGDFIVDLPAIEHLFTGDAATVARAASAETLNGVLALGNRPASALRLQLSRLLSANGGTEFPLVPIAEAELRLPAQVHQFTDMCASTFHIGGARNKGPRDAPVVPAVMKWLPVGYNGRASSVVVSGTDVRRPNGQWLADADDKEPRFGPEPRQDYELEMGLWLGGPGNALGEPIPLDRVAPHLFGFCLMNDWSARGIQMWETMLGPFLGKSQATTVSPWIVTAEALEPFAAPALARPAGDPAPFPYLYSAADQASGGYDIALEAFVTSGRMRAAGLPAHLICRSNFKHMYWSWAQMVAHHASNGCNLGPGDLLGSGTCSGPADDAAGCLLELTGRGSRSWSLPGGEQRVYLDDGDEISLTARASRDGYVSIGFGACTGRITPAPAL